jgi:hypothetical protein
LPSSTTAYCSIPFAITVPNLEFLSIQDSMHEPQTRLCGLLAIVLQINNTKLPGISNNSVQDSNFIKNRYIIMGGIVKINPF